MSTQHVHPVDSSAVPAAAQPINCEGLNSIGSAPSTVLQPEQGVDEELRVRAPLVRRLETQLTLYNTNIYDKLYSTIVPLCQTGTAFIPPAYLRAGHAGRGGEVRRRDRAVAARRHR